ncbi:site-specific tyrosine recombinase/integron integrase [Infirmifilum sp. NZ]|uniref:site-specific tyrosine recombinase/integron integrase n=1 Tax=Infirmifilum sp. NZ TaxID=2926850 RepID=UPI0027A11661|nr:site-specific tyrosine recombinase/integron integrase [Infirmifilum sp. NZ]UNQ74076.1 tyrosine-type recombinase/integrase [Infirmifilum sp. NZ]
MSREASPLALSNQELVELYISHLIARNRSERTIRYFRSILESFLQFLDGKRISEVQLYDIDLFLARLRQSGWKPDSLYTAAVAVKRFLEFVGKEDALRGFELPRREKKLPRYLEPEEVKRMVEQADSIRDKLIVMLLFTTGLRVAELVNIRRTDIDLERRTIRVKGKGAKERYVYFPQSVAELLAAYVSSNDSEWLFPSSKDPSSHIHYTTVERVLKTLARKAGLSKKVTPHLLRHTFATLSLASGLDVREIQELLGHSNLNTTQVYAHVSRERLRKDYERVWGSVL